MQQQLTDILDNILGLLLLEGSYNIEEDEAGYKVDIDTKDAGRLIGARGESLESLQLLVGMIFAKKLHEKEDGFKRVIVDVNGWRKQKEDDLVGKAKNWAQRVLESGQEMELEPMPSWQRRVVHMSIQDMDGVESESIGEGFERRLVIKPASGESQKSEPATAE